jgi:manganese efflux pump family protein
LFTDTRLTEFAKIFAVALAIGLDVLAISVGIGVAGVARQARMRLGLAFATTEISVQFIGYELGAGMGRLLGDIGTYVGFGLLAMVGLLMLRASRRPEEPRKFDATTGFGLLMTSLSISLDSLAVGVALPGAHIALDLLMPVVSFTTIGFTFTGLAFGARLGARYEHGAESLAGVILIALASLFALVEALRM